MKLTDEQIERVQSLERNGRLDAATVLEDATDTSSPLHSLFVWDNERAAYEYRLEQAREVVRSVEYHITRTTITITAPRYIPDPSRPGNRAGYVRTDQVATDPAQAVLAVTAELNRALGVLHRAQRLASVLEQGEDVGALVAALTAIRDRLRNGGTDEAAARTKRRHRQAG